MERRSTRYIASRITTKVPLKRKHSCTKCGKKFLSKLQLRKHVKHGMCTVLKNFICEDCEPHKGFKRMISLQRYQNVFHKNTIAKQQCPQCKKKFGSVNSLKSHIKWHKSIQLLQRAQMLRKRRNYKNRHLQPESHHQGCPISQTLQSYSL